MLKKQSQLAGLRPEILNNENLSDSSGASVANLKKQTQSVRSWRAVLSAVEGSHTYEVVKTNPIGLPSVGRPERGRGF